MKFPLIVTEQSPPIESRLVNWYQDADLVDTFSAPLPNGLDNSIRFIGEAVLGQPMPGLKTLFSIRNGVARCLGLKTVYKPRNSGSDHVGIFLVLSVHDDELILGKDDRLMILRISLLSLKGSDGLDRVLVTTVVRCYNRRARAYIALIKPFHRLLIRLSLRRAAKADFALESIA